VKLRPKDAASAKSARPRSLGNTIGLALVAVVTIVILVAFLRGDIRSPRQRTVTGLGTQGSQGQRVGPDRKGAPWEYDAATDAHWNPLAGHEHWHQGQPPTPGSNGRSAEDAGGLASASAPLALPGQPPVAPPTDPSADE
jgi:hypothetical protein